MPSLFVVFSQLVMLSLLVVSSLHADEIAVHTGQRNQRLIVVAPESFEPALQEFIEFKKTMKAEWLTRPCRWNCFRKVF
jgi:hypothetical protein